MSDGTPLLDWTPPRTHAGDPPSSHAAEQRLRDSGKLSRCQRAVLAAVRQYPGHTAEGYAERLAGHPDFPAGEYERVCAVRKRLSDLGPAGLGLKLLRRQHVRGDRASRWFPVEA